MRITLLYFLLFAATVASAQDTAGRIIRDTTIIRDTINLRGYIYQSDGKPAKIFSITSSYRQASYSFANTNDVKMGAVTDTNGYFELRGARLYDTLTMDQPLFYGPPQYYYNRGSRYMVIYLPPIKVVAITKDKPVIITRKRIHPKARAVYHPQPTGNLDYFEVHKLPSYKGISINSSYKDQYLVFTDSLQAHINYPAKAIANNVEGLVKVSFTVDRNGILTFKLLQGIGYGCDDEVINAIRHLPGWIPAIDNGRPVVVEQTVSVEFKLTDK